MTNSERPSNSQDLAAEFVLGTLDGPTQRWVEAQLAVDPLLRQRVQEWQERLGTLAEAIAPVEPPASVLDRINAQLDRDEKLRTAEGTVFAAEGEWVAIAAGVQIKILAHNDVDQSRSFLLRMEPGSRLPMHRHAAVEECMMLQGDLVLGGVALAAGDYHRMPAGTVHPKGISHSGCLAFIRADARASLT